MKKTALAVLRVFTVVLALVLTRGTARAALLPSYDLASLGFKATHVVRAKPVKETKIDEYTTVRTMVVTKNYKGGLAEGATFTVSYNLYSLDTWEDLTGSPAKQKPVLGSEMVFFMSRAETPPVEFTIHSSGIRIFLDGQAHRFVQISNPGGYYPVPQGLDPHDLCTGTEKGVDLAGFEAMLAVVLQRATDLKRAMAKPATPENNLALAHFLGDVVDHSDVPACHDDPLAVAILFALATRGDVASLADAASRTAETRYRVQGASHERELLGLAENKATPLASRVAALRLLAKQSSSGLEDAKLESRVVALYADPAPTIRVAALSVELAEGSMALVQKGIRGRWNVETDQRVRVALVRAAVRSDLANDLKIPGASLPVIAAYATSDMVVIPWADIATDVQMMAKSVMLTMSREGKARTATLPITTAMMTGGGQGVLIANISFPGSPLPPGDYSAEIRFTLEDDNHHHAPITKTIRLGTLAAPKALSFPPPLTKDPFPIPDVDEPASRAPASISAPAPIQEKVVPRRAGCGCNVTERENHGTNPSSVGLFLLALLVARRSHQSKSCSSAPLSSHAFRSPPWPATATPTRRSTTRRTSS